MLLLGRTPLARRIVAALLLVGAGLAAAIGPDGAISWIEIIANLTAALAAFVFLHYRWRARERRALTPRRIRDTFR